MIAMGPGGFMQTQKAKNTDICWPDHFPEAMYLLYNEESDFTIFVDKDFYYEDLNAGKAPIGDGPDEYIIIAERTR